MSAAPDLLLNVRGIIKLYDFTLKEICIRHNMTLLEGTVISFLYNHPHQDTAGDIVEIRKLSKGNVSMAVDSLIQKSMLSRFVDPKDRRKIHLSLLPASAPVTGEIAAAMKQCRGELFNGFSEEEILQYERLSARIFDNMERASKRRKLL